MRLPRVMPQVTFGEMGIVAQKSSMRAADDGDSSLTLFVERGEHSRRVAGNLDVAPLAQQAAVRADQERRADDADVLAAVQRLFGDHVERLAPGLVSVGDEIEIQIVLGDEAVVR